MKSQENMAKNNSQDFYELLYRTLKKEHRSQASTPQNAMHTAKKPKLHMRNASADIRDKLEILLEQAEYNRNIEKARHYRKLNSGRSSLSIKSKPMHEKLITFSSTYQQLPVNYQTQDKCLLYLPQSYRPTRRRVLSDYINEKLEVYTNKHSDQECAKKFNEQVVRTGFRRVTAGSISGSRSNKVFRPVRMDRCNQNQRRLRQGQSRFQQ